jgi:hypothetical protein
MDRQNIEGALSPTRGAAFAYLAVVLVVIKLVHTIVWAVMVGIIVAIPWFVIRRKWCWTSLLIGLVLLECAVLAINHMRCPLTDLAAHYTSDRSANFDIFLPLWLAANNKTIFGTLFGVELVWTGWERVFSGS